MLMSFVGAHVGTLMAESGLAEISFYHLRLEVWAKC